MAETVAVASSTSSTEVQVIPVQTEGTLSLTLNKPKTDRRVQWQESVVDNEFLGKKSSKCCCIYSPPQNYGQAEDSDSSDGGDDCCHEHRVARKRLGKKPKSQPLSESSSPPDLNQHQ